LATGAFGVPPPTGWDWNPYTTGGNLAFYWGGTTNPQSGGVVATATTTPFLALAAGTMIDATSTFAQTANAAATSNFRGVTGAYLGVRFQNEGTGTVNYGWVRLNTPATTGVPAVITAFCFEDSGAGIPAGTTPVSLQGFSVD
jgi:hypothetical protein